MTDDVLPFADDCRGFTEEEFYARYKMSRHIERRLEQMGLGPPFIGFPNSNLRIITPVGCREWEAMLRQYMATPAAIAQRDKRAAHARKMAAAALAAGRHIGTRRKRAAAERKAAEAAA
jgi:hypothetical protein